MRIKHLTLTALVITTSVFTTACGDTRKQGESSAATDPGGTLRWGGDEIGGAPYMFRDPNDNTRHIGFEKEIADEIGKRLNRKMEFIQTPWDSIIPALNRGDFDFALSGMEVTPERTAVIDFTDPYYVYTKQLVVRSNSNDIKSLKDLQGRVVGTLLESTSHKYLEKHHLGTVITYEDSQRPYDELEMGKIDAVFLDLPIAEFYARPNKNLKFIGSPIAPGHYAIAVRKKDEELKLQLNDALKEIKEDGTLKQILEKWNLWNDVQTTGTAEL
jgi:polar amino acid transport system substrate-binding protein